MKQNIEIDLPDGYEIEIIEHAYIYAEHNPTQLVTVRLKKKAEKTLASYVDDYLRSDDNTTADMFCNWLEYPSINVLKSNIKQGKFEFVPWEIKVGLIRFICKDKGLLFDCFASGEFDKTHNYGKDKLKQVCPFELIDSVL